ncbi:hypothetical protein RZS08_64935, partial [Arthrospira platensis SPKY1]|nr:hypothetical protein [Arthrospira platensis SPKY1]
MAGAIMLTTVIGFWDDSSGLPVWPRLLIYTVAALMIGQAVFAWPALLLAALFLLAWANAYNFMDGINGMAAVYGIVFLLSLWALPRPQVPSLA